MTSRLDTSPQVRLRLLARNLDLAERDADEALSRADGDVLSAEQMLRNLTLRTRQVVRPGSCTTLTRDQRIRKCASALACTPDALELLHASLNKVYEQPHNERLRKVNVTTGIFHARVAANNPAGVELLYAVGYEPMHGHLVLQKHDPTVLAVALQELGAAKHLPAYIVAITARADDRARREETAREAAAKAMLRASYLAKVPAEPSEADAVNHASSACVITVGVANGDAPAGNAPRVATRRFDSDCTLEDLVNYVRSLPAVTTPDGELTIANVTTRPTRVLDAAAESHASLYALDLWPRGRIEPHPAKQTEFATRKVLHNPVNAKPGHANPNRDRKNGGGGKGTWGKMGDDYSSSQHVYDPKDPLYDPEADGRGLVLKASQ